MIRSFRNGTTERVFNGEFPRELPRSIIKTARRKLRMVEAARELTDLRVPPGNKLHALDRDRIGQHAIWINDQYRVCFEWREGDAYNVEITDYH
jgi:proteic killer suppression protein